MSDELHVWEIVTGERFWVSATSSEDAIRVLMESNMAEDYETLEAFVEGETPKIRQLPDDEPLSVNDESLGGKITKSARCWAEDEGRGYVAGTVW